MLSTHVVQHATGANRRIEGLLRVILDYIASLGPVCLKLLKYKNKK